MDVGNLSQSLRARRLSRSSSFCRSCAGTLPRCFMSSRILLPRRLTLVPTGTIRSMSSRMISTDAADEVNSRSKGKKLSNMLFSANAHRIARVLAAESAQVWSRSRIEPVRSCGPLPSCRDFNLSCRRHRSKGLIARIMHCRTGQFHDNASNRARRVDPDGNIGRHKPDDRGAEGESLLSRVSLMSF